MTHTTVENPGVLPTLNDVLAGGVLFGAYIIRMGTAGSPTMDTPIYLMVLTDFVLPLLAGLWLWVVSIWLLYRRVSG